MAKTVVPYTREMKRGNRARDVLAMKRALTRAGALKPPNKPHKITNAFGDRTREALTAFQKKHGYKATGTYTRPVHDRLVRKGHFDAYGAHLMRLAKTAQTKQAPSASAGQRIASAALYAQSRRPRHYTQGAERWQPVNRAPGWKSNMWEYGDCSSFATGCFREAGITRDPNGQNWAWGWTGTLCKNGRAVNSAQPGDLIFYGSGAPWSHVVVAIGGGKCVSHGSEGGPFLVPVNYRTIGQIRRYV